MVFKTNRDIFNFLKEPASSANAELIFDEIIRQFDQPTSQHDLNILKGKIETFCSHLRKRWSESNRVRGRFCQKNEGWLDLNFVYPEWTATVSEFVPKPFNECSERHKMRRVEELKENHMAEELLFAAKLKLRLEGKKDAAKIVDQLLRDLEAPKISSDFCEKLPTQPCLTNEKALSLYTALDLSRSKYNVLRDLTMAEGLRIFPSAYQIKKAKLDCYPENKFIQVDERTGSVSLQGLLDHTVSRILYFLNLNEEVINTQEHRELTMITKWGCDGSSNQSIYKQSFASSTGPDSNSDDSSIFLTTLVPIKLLDSNNAAILWENLKPSSTEFCRPLHLKFCKESIEVIKEEIGRVESQIESLIPTQINALKINHQLHLTMIDGKICNVVTNTKSSLRCNICGATVKEMNDIECIENKIPNEEYYKFGIPPLHAKIKFFECLLHISFNLDFKTWSATGSNKELKNLRKKDVQEKFRNRLGLHVDRVKQGVGNFNDGNTARKFFEDPKITAELTGLNEELITRFAVILQVISCTHWVNTTKFGQYARDTAQLFVDLYGWYYMPPTVHKVLVHGEKIIEHAVVPIGMLSEEAQEAINKKFRQTREFKSRKISRTTTNEDILHYLLISSDPLISSIKPSLHLRQQIKKTFFPEALQLLENFHEITEEVDNEPMEWENETSLDC